MLNVPKMIVAIRVVDSKILSEVSIKSLAAPPPQNLADSFGTKAAKGMVHFLSCSLQQSLWKRDMLKVLPLAKD